MNARRQSLARNMSAPPSTTLTFAALAPESGATGDAVADGAGLAFVCRLDARALLPRTRRNAGARPGTARIPSMSTDRIRVALVYARAEAAGRKRAPPKAIAKACAAPVEDAGRRVARPARRGVARRRRPAGVRDVPAAAGGERAILRSFSRTLAILARRRGTLFLRDADPIVWSAMDGEVLDLWTPAAAPGSAS